MAFCMCPPPPPLSHGLVLVQFLLLAAVFDFFELKAGADKQQRALRGLPSAIMCADRDDCVDFDAGFWTLR